MAHLRELAARNVGLTELTDDGLAHLSGMISLKSLVLSYCTRITDAGLANIGHITDITSLNLCCCA